MRVHYLQHVPFEGIGAIEDWVRARGHGLTGTHLFRATAGDTGAGAAAQTAAAPAAPDHPELPTPDQFDLLVIMGGPMSIHDHAEYPWLEPERAFIKAAIDSDKAVLGICLGAQLMADVLAAPVTRNSHKEIGWYPVQLTEAGRVVPVFADFPPGFTALHWHGDTFAIPEGAAHVSSSEACLNQAFSLADGRVVGLQFHLEETPAALNALLEHAGDDLTPSKAEPWVQSADGLLAENAPYDTCRQLLFKLLDRMAATVS